VTPHEIRALALRYFSCRNNPINAYFAQALAPWLIGPIVEWTAEAILRYTPDAQAIAFRGMSGAAVAPLVAYRLGLNPLGVRKGESSHGGDTFYPEGLNGEAVRRYVIVDDFVCSGATVHEVRSMAEKGHGLEPCLGVFQYTKLDMGVEQRRSLSGVPCYGTLPPAWGDCSFDPPKPKPKPQPEVADSLRKAIAPSWSDIRVTFGDIQIEPFTCVVAV
jgi:hypothetical protein